MTGLGERVRTLREDRDLPLTQDELSRRSGIARTILSRVELGGTAKLDTLRQLARGLGLTPEQWTDLLIDWIRLKVGEEDWRRLEVRPCDRAAAPQSEAQHVLRLYRALGEKDRREIIRAMERPAAVDVLKEVNRVLDLSTENPPSKPSLRKSFRR